MSYLYKIGITRIPRIGPITIKSLVAYCGGVQSIFYASAKTLLSVPGVNQAAVRAILDHRDEALRRAERELQLLEGTETRLFFYLDEHYPGRLRHQLDAPIMLYQRGPAPLDYGRGVAIIGTRKPSNQGISLCERLVDELQQYRVTVLSGLAYGIDISAHKQCLQSGISTIAVLAHGFDQIYPAVHRPIAQEIAATGALLTEYPAHVRAEKEFFPLRNRIVAGLCDALIVVETGKRGGSMITAKLANEYNKDVFAFPGRITDAKSAGCNILIKSHQASLLEGAQDLAYIMGWKAEDNREGQQQQLFVELSAEEKVIVDLLRHDTGISVDRLAHLSEKSNSELAALLLSLECKGKVRSLPGNRFIST